MVDVVSVLLDIVFFPFTSTSPLVIIPFCCLVVTCVITLFYRMMRVVK